MQPPAHYVLYCLIRQPTPNGAVAFATTDKQGLPCFPATRIRQGEDLYDALDRIAVEDLGLKPGAFFPEKELAPLENAGESSRHRGLDRRWHIYPVDLSLDRETRKRLKHDTRISFRTLSEIGALQIDPNVRRIIEMLQAATADESLLTLESVHAAPSMQARACRWAANNRSGARVARKNEITGILDSGSRAFNLRVADPYLPYHKQGMGFTWSFFTPKDTQDIHVHGASSIEMDGALKGGINKERADIRFDIFY